MACDDLREQTFKNAMKTIGEQYVVLHNTYTNDFLAATENFYSKGWRSPKGAEKTNALVKAVSTACGEVSAWIYRNYNIMVEGATEFARKQNHNTLSIGDISVKDYNSAGSLKTFSGESDAEIHVDLDTMTSILNDEIIPCFNKFDSIFDIMEDITSSYEKFGYRSDGNDPRENMHSAIKEAAVDFRAALNNFTTKMFEYAEEDAVARQAAIDKSRAETLSSLSSVMDE